MERKGCELIIHDHDPNFWVTIVGWVDVPDSERGNLRRRRAVDTSSWQQNRENSTFYVGNDFIRTLLLTTVVVVMKLAL